MSWITDKTANHENASLDDGKVKSILSGKAYVKEAKDTSFITKKGEYEILYSELYSQNENSEILTTLDIGKFVKGYNSTKGKGWRLLYFDSESAYLLANRVGTVNIKNKYESAGETGEVSALGKKLNPKFTSWTLKSDGNNLNENIKAVSWLTNESNWLGYKEDYANWVIGAPTIELFIKSYNVVCKNSTLEATVTDATSTGYTLNGSSLGKRQENPWHKLLGLSEWVMSSPSGKMSSGILASDYEGYSDGSSISEYTSGNYYVRPCVSVPISKFEDGTLTLDTQGDFKDEIWRDSDSGYDSGSGY